MSLETLKVLLVDDDVFQLEVITQTLQSMGITQVTQASSGAQALACLARTKPDKRFDLMVCDLHMPEMDGFQFMAEVDMSGFTGALIILSGQNWEVLHSASLVAKLRRFKLLGAVQKPVQMAELATLINPIV
jgi:CheY-like chemotaxis protein